MNTKTRAPRRILSTLLSAVMLLSIFTFTAFAAEGDEPVSVSTGAELDAAIRALTDGSLTINLTADIDAVSSATYTGYRAGAALIINGNGHTINGNDVNKTGLRFGARGQALNLRVTDTTFTNMPNSDRHGGGAIGLWSGELYVSGCTFTNNAATSGVGGAIRHQGGTTTYIANSTFTGNSATGAGGALNIGVSGTLDNISVIGNTSSSSTSSVGGINGSASRELTLTNSAVYGNTLVNMANVIDGGGNTLRAPASNLSITYAEDKSEKLKKVFAVGADVNTTPVNLIEGVIYYDSALYDVNVYLAEQFNSAAVAMIKDDGAGRVKVVIGVKNEETIGYDDALVVAFVEMTPKAGQTPDRAYVQLGDVKAYSRGDNVEVTTTPNDALAMYTYRSIHDVNDDGVVNAADLSLALYYFGTDNRDADINKDGTVDMLDITALVQALYA